MDIFDIYYRNKNDQEKTGMENYMRNQFKFLGIKRPIRNEISREFLKAKKKEKSIDWDFVEEAYEKSEREFKYLVIDYLRGNEKYLEKEDIYKLKKIILMESWWDTVDLLSKVVGSLLLKHEDLKKEIIIPWSTDENMWLRRVSLLYQLSYKENTDLELLELLIKNNLDSEEFFINKAIGWILREYSKTDENWVREFVEEYGSKLSSLTKREGLKYIERS